MSDELGSGHPEPLNQEVRTLWESKAAYWDERMGDNGNEFQSTLVDPAAERLLGVEPGEVLLDVACGSGIMSRRLAALGARVVAIDFSQSWPLDGPALWQSALSIGSSTAPTPVNCWHSVQGVLTRRSATWR